MNEWWDNDGYHNSSNDTKIGLWAEHCKDQNAEIAELRRDMSEVREIARGLSGALQISVKESDLLRRQVAVLAGEINVHICDRGCDACPLDAECHPSGMPNDSYCVTAISAWSLAKAKEGGAGE